MKPEQQKNLLFILIPSIILIIIWIAFGIVNIYSKPVTTNLSALQRKAILPISPTFEQGIFDLLRKRTVIKPLFTPDTSAPAFSSDESSLGAELIPALPQAEEASSQATLQEEIP